MSTPRIQRALLLTSLALCHCTGSVLVDDPEAGAGSGGPSSGTGGGPYEHSQQFQAEPGALRKLTVAQYRNSVRDVLGAEIVVPDDLEADTAVNGYSSIAAAQGTVSPSAAEKFEAAAYDIAAQAMAEPLRARLVACVPAGVTDEACARETLSAIGARAFRRSLTEVELGRFSAVAIGAAGVLGDFHAGLEFGLAAILQSFPFLYRVEIGEPDPANPAVYRYSAGELATRLSYLIWNTTPDDELLASAADERLLAPDELAAQSRRLLASPRAREGVATFHDERFRLSHLEQLAKDPATYPQLTDTLIEAMRREVQELVTDVVAGQRDYRELLTGRTTFVNDELGALYGLSTSGSDFEKTTFPETSARSGLLTSAAFLAMHAGNVETSPSKRGKFVRESILCQSIPEPPPGVSTVIPPQPTKTMREKLAAHAMDPKCAGCHAIIDPIGLAFEHFDAIGAFRETDDGVALDVSGNLDGTPFADARELSELLAASPEAADCTVRSLYRHALGHIERPGEEPAIEELTAAFTSSNHRFDALVEALAASPALRLAAKPVE